MSDVYILHSNSLDKFYVGLTTLSPEERLDRHLNKFYEKTKTFTRKANDWILVWSLECETIEQARNLKNTSKK
jgi:putative endonuclease